MRLPSIARRALVSHAACLLLATPPTRVPAFWATDWEQPSALGYQRPWVPSWEDLDIKRAATNREPAMLPKDQGRLLQTARIAPREANIRPLTLRDATELIRMRCDPMFLAAVRASGGRFLYRGEDLAAASAAVLSPPPDLLQLDTYGEREALVYFESLERGLRAASRVAARPSSGHIAVARASAAAQWGPAVSVWPLGAPLHYVWPSARDDFWPASDAQVRAGVSVCSVDAGLAEALRLGREVLFASEQGADFVAVAATADDEVRRLLAPWRATE